MERFLQRPGVRDLTERFGRAATVETTRSAMDALRRRMTTEDPGGTLDGPDPIDWLERTVTEELRRTFAPSLVPVINATGVIVHTNLGRAPLPAAALDRLHAVAAGYVNLEYDLPSGQRGSRHVHAEHLITRLTGADAALVVNNNAAATLLILAGLASGREVIVSRGELVEIGGGFRVPDILALSGATLREVGTTNRTRAADYAAAIGPRTALILRVHPSNFRIEGFVERPAAGDLVDLGRQFQIPVVEDQGSGNLHPFRLATSAAGPGMSDEAPAGSGRADIEPTIHDSVRSGVDAICFSGDKLLGGPQAGIIVGRAALLARLRAHPFLRAVRADKLTYAALEATLVEHLAGRGPTTVPVVRSLTMSRDAIDERAKKVAAALGHVPGLQTRLLDGASTVGGGSAPGSRLPTRLLALAKETWTPGRLERRLRQLDPPVIARIEHDIVVLDLRTVAPDDDDVLIAALRAL